MFELRVESILQADPDQVWRWITDVDCLREEMHPLLWMSVPPGIRNLGDVRPSPGVALFTSRLWLLRVLPIGVSHLTLLEMTPGSGFIEQSPMTGMRLWRHERRLYPHVQGTQLVDTLSVDAYWPQPLMKTFLRLFFARRHRVLRRREARPTH